MSERGVSPPRGTSPHEPRLHGGGHRFGLALRGRPLRLPLVGSHGPDPPPRVLPKRVPRTGPLWRGQGRVGACPPPGVGTRVLAPASSRPCGGRGRPGSL